MVDRYGTYNNYLVAYQKVRNNMKIVEPKNVVTTCITNVEPGEIIEYVDFSSSCVRTCIVGNGCTDDTIPIMDVQTGEIDYIGDHTYVTHYKDAQLLL